MRFRRGGEPNERRRRVLSGEGDESTAANNAAKSDIVAKAYADAALAETEKRLADLIPVRPLGVFVLGMLGLIGVFGVQLLYMQLPKLRLALGAANVTAFDLTARGSLASWLSAALLATGAAQSAMIYVIRRHKADDYRGRYRMWIWAAGLLMLASIDAVARLHDAVAAAGTWLVGSTPFGVTSSWWLITAGVLYGGMAVRVGIDMRRCRTALLAFAICLAGYVAGCYFAWVNVLPDATLAAMTTVGCFTLSHLMLWLTLALYSRHVLLDARGELPLPKVRKKKEKKPKQKKVKAAKAEEAADSEEKSTRRKTKSGKTVKVDPPHNKAKKKRTDVEGTAKRKHSVGATITKKKQAAVEEAASTPVGEPDEFGPGEGTPEWTALSKSQRRRIKKLRRRNQ